MKPDPNQLMASIASRRADSERIPVSGTNYTEKNWRSTKMRGIQMRPKSFAISISAGFDPG